MRSIEDKAGGALAKSKSGARKDESVRESREEQRVLGKTETLHVVGPRLEERPGLELGSGLEVGRGWRPWSYQKNFKSDGEG